MHGRVSHLQDARNRRHLLVSPKLESFLLFLHAVDDILHRGQFARHTIDAFDLEAVRFDVADAEESGVDQKSETDLSSDFESSPALDDQRNEDVGMFRVIVLQTDAEQQRLAFADKGVDICVGKGSECGS